MPLVVGNRGSSVNSTLGRNQIHTARRQHVISCICLADDERLLTKNEGVSRDSAVILFCEDTRANDARLVPTCKCVILTTELGNSRAWVKDTPSVEAHHGTTFRIKSRGNICNL